jgi:hypothetical protein
METQAQKGERTDILNAMGEIRNRLKDIKRRTDLLRSDVVGEGEAQDVPEAVPSAHLDGRLWELYPIIESIESNIARLMSRIGCRGDVAGVPGATNALKARASGY